MASTTFVDTITHIPASWANDVNTLVYDIFEGASTKLAARNALGLGTIALQNAEDVMITGGSIDDTVIGQSIPAQAKFTRAQVVLAPLNPQDATNKAYVDALFTPVLTALAGKYDKTGGPISGPVSITGTLTMNATRIINVANPVLAQDAATKAYVDAALAGLSLNWGLPVQDLTALAAIPAVDVQDKQVRFVENENAIYSYDSTSVAPPSPPDVIMPGFGIGRWLRIGTFTASHNALSGLQGGMAAQYYHLTSSEYSWLQNVIAEGILATPTTFEVNNKRVTNVLNPVSPQDAATKSYVDGLVVSPALSSISAATSSASINNLNNQITWQWSASAATQYFSITDGSPGFAGATLLSIRTGVGSATNPLEVVSNGVQRLAILQSGGWSIGGSQGTAGQVLTSSGPGAPPVWATLPAGTPAGSDTQVQFNNAGAFGASSNLTWISTTNTLNTVNLNATTQINIGTRITLQQASPNIILGEDGWTSIIRTRDAVAANTASGDLVITNGTPSGTGNGGNITIEAGSTTGAAGSQNAGTVTIRGGLTATNVTGTAGSVVIEAGSALDTTTGGTAGNISLTAGNSWLNVGNISITAGSTTNTTSATSPGGNITISGGLQNFTTPNLVTIQGGTNRNSGTAGGTVLVTGGTNIVSGPGGEVRIEGGDGFTTGNGGRVLIAGGTAAGGANDGYLDFVTGTTQRLRINYNGEWQLGATFDAGTAGQALVSNGPGAAPTWQSVGGSVVEPANQIVYGTGVGVDSDPDFTWDPTANSLVVNGYQTQRIGNFAAAGDAQTRNWVLRTTTTNATLTEMLINGTDRMILPDDTTWHFEIKLVARRTDVNDEGAAYKIEGCIDRNTGAATTALVGATVDSIISEDSTAWDFDVNADTVNGALKLEVQGEAGKTIRWVAFVKTVEVTG